MSGANHPNAGRAPHAIRNLIIGSHGPVCGLGHEAAAAFEMYSKKQKEVDDSIAVDIDEKEVIIKEIMRLDNRLADLDFGIANKLSVRDRFEINMQEAAAANLRIIKETEKIIKGMQCITGAKEAEVVQKMGLRDYAPLFACKCKLKKCLICNGDWQPPKWPLNPDGEECENGDPPVAPNDHSENARGGRSGRRRSEAARGASRRR